MIGTDREAEGALHRRARGGSAAGNAIHPCDLVWMKMAWEEYVPRYRLSRPKSGVGME